MKIDFKQAKADRNLSGDPRRSIEERYPSFEKYYDQVKRAVENMVKDRLLLCEDADDQLERLVLAGQARASRRRTATCLSRSCGIASHPNLRR